MPYPSEKLKSPGGQGNSCTRLPTSKQTQHEISFVWLTLVGSGLKSDGDRRDRGNSRMTLRFSGQAPSLEPTESPL